MGWRDRIGWLRSELKQLLAKEVLKRIALALITLAGGWLWAVLQRIFDEGYAGTPLVERLRKVWLEVSSDPLAYSFALLREYPGSTSLALVLIAGYLILFVLLRRTQRKLLEVQVERALALRAGIGGWWPNTKQKADDGAPWQDLCAEISRPENRILLILGANGIETFGRQGAPLYECLGAFRGTVRVVLAHPDSPETRGRAIALGVKLQDYKRAIANSAARLRDLRQQHHVIDGRFYDGQPNWKMIITSRTAWIQYYAPGTHVDGTPVWRFDVTDDGNGLYYLFANEFERIWRRCQEHEMF